MSVGFLKNLLTRDLCEPTTLPKAANFYNGGSMGNSSSVVESSWNFASEFSWNDRGEFELDRAKSKNIAENSFALGHEMHNSAYFCRH